MGIWITTFIVCCTTLLAVGCNTQPGKRRDGRIQKSDNDLARWNTEPQKSSTFTNPDTSDWIVYAPKLEDLTAATVLDASRYVEAPSGKHGFLESSADGSFVFKDGTPARFFGGQGNLFYPKKFTPGYIQWLRQRGMNLVRTHGFGLPNKEKWDRMDFFINECKKGGIYVVLTPLYWTSVNVKGPDGKQTKVRNSMICFFNQNVEEALQEIWKTFWTHKNPYTGLRYCDDPTIAMTELKNEDSAFWAVDDVLRRTEPVFWREVLKKYSAWLGRKYKTEDALRQAWTDKDGPCALKDNESIAKGNIDILIMEPWWDYTSPEQKFPRQRKSDQMQFLHEQQKGFYERSYAYLKKLGVKQAICGSNWRGKAYTWRLVTQLDSTLDYIDQHDYWDHPSGGWHVGDATFHNQSMIRDERGGLVGKLAPRQVLNKPFALSEWNIGNRNEHTMEAIFLMTAYGSLQGWDALMQFVVVPGQAWNKKRSYYIKPDINLLGPAFFNVANDPSVAMQYFTLSRVWHRGDIRASEPILIKRIDPSMYYKPGPIETKHTPYAYMFNGGELPKTKPGVHGFMAAAVGRIGTEFVSKPTDHYAHPDIASFLDEKKKIARSITGELQWNWGRGVAIVNTPRTQGVCGFAAGGTITTENVTIKMKTSYGIVMVTTLNDEKTIEGSDHLLITALGQSRNTGQKNGKPVPGRHKGHQAVAIVEEGTSPILVEPITGTISLKVINPTRIKVYLLDHAGRRGKEVKPTIKDGWLKLVLPGEHKTFFYELVR